MKKKVKNSADQVGALKFWAWQGRAVSNAVNFIVLSFVTIYCTNALKMPPALVGTLLLGSKLVDGFTDLAAGFIVDRTNTKLGKGRPYELAILGVWISTWLLFSVPGEASLLVKSIWVITAYIFTNSIFVTMLSACNNAYMIRAFKSSQQRVKVASFGGIVIMVSAVVINILFPIMMNRIATTAAGWSRLAAIIAIPMALIGIMRFIFVKESEDDTQAEEKAHWKDVITLLKTNPYIYMVSFNQLVYSLVTGMGVFSFFFTFVVGDVERMGIAMMLSTIVLPLLFFFPIILKRIPMGRLVQIGGLSSVIGGLLIYFSQGQFSIVSIAFIFVGIGSLPLTYLTDLMMIDCGTYNKWKGNNRMDGTIGAIKGFANKLGGAIGSGVLGLMLGVSGYDGALSSQPASAVNMISSLAGLLPAILYSLVIVLMFLYKLDKLIPEMNKAIKEKSDVEVA